MQDSIPESTLLVYHTAHIPQQVDKPDKWESDRYLYPHVSQLNAAGRHVAQSLHYHLIDIEAMALQLPKEAMLSDITHPGAGFMMQAGPWKAAACAAECYRSCLHALYQICCIAKIAARCICCCSARAP